MTTDPREALHLGIAQTLYASFVGGASGGPNDMAASLADQMAGDVVEFLRAHFLAPEQVTIASEICEDTYLGSRDATKEDAMRAALRSLFGGDNDK